MAPGNLLRGALGLLELAVARVTSSFFFLFFLTTLCSLHDLSSPTRDRTQGQQGKHRVLLTRLDKESPSNREFPSYTLLTFSTQSMKTELPYSMEINSGASLMLQDSPQGQAEAGSLPEIEPLLGLFPGPSCSSDSLLGALPQETLGSRTLTSGAAPERPSNPNCLPRAQSSLAHLWAAYMASSQKFTRRDIS